MPTYEYSCKRCGETIEVFQSFSEKPLRKHQECGGELKKVFHARGVVFKGSGFYSTDSRSTSTKKSEEPAQKGGDSSKKSDSSKKVDSSKKSESSTASTSSSPSQTD